MTRTAAWRSWASVPSPLRIEVDSASSGTMERMMAKVRAEARMVMCVRKYSAYMMSTMRVQLRPHSRARPAAGTGEKAQARSRSPRP